MEERYTDTSKKIMERIGFVIDLSLIVLAVAIMVSTAVCGRISLFGYSFGTVMSGSMLPEYEVYSLIVVSPDKDLETGQVGVYEVNGKKIVHRVWKRTNNVYQFKGDNNKEPDPYPITEEQIVGKVIWHTNAFAKVIRTLGEGKLDYVYIILVLLIIISSMTDIIKRMK